MTHLHKTLDIVALGEAMVEFNQRPSSHAGEAPHYQQGFGGDTSNAAIAAARAGARVAYLTRLGTDRWGDHLMDLWQRENVATNAVQREPQAPLRRPRGSGCPSLPLRDAFRRPCPAWPPQR